MRYCVNHKNQSQNVISITFIALIVFCCLAAVATASDRNSAAQAGFGSSGEILRADVKAAAGVIDRVYEQGSLPVIVRLRDSDLPYGFAPDIVRARGGMIGELQSTVLDDVSAQTSRDASALNAKRFSTMPAMALHVSAAELEALLDHPDVVEIIEDTTLEPMLDDSVALIGGELDGSFETYTGQGQVVAIIDTGVDKNHPFLSGKVVSEACYSSNNADRGVTSLCPGKAESSTAVNSGLNCDSDISICGHGTYVAGVVAGNGNKFSGVAKDASILAIQVFSLFSDCGDYPSPCLKTYSSDVIQALERVYALRNTYAIASVNMSFGSSNYDAECSNSMYRPIIDTLRAVGIATVVASGNGSSTTGISSPACVASSVSVGSTTKADAVSSFSNSADFLSLLAPGSSITTCLPGTHYGEKSGTSMAAPHVAGAWAVIKQAQPDASVAEVLDALQTTGEPIVDSRSGAGSRVKPRINVQQALDELNKCEDSAECDDGQFCNGVETCSGGTCVVGTLPCGGDRPACDERSESCVKCLNSDKYGSESLENFIGKPMADQECTDRTDCPSGFACMDNICDEAGKLTIVQKKLYSKKLVKKSKKLKLTITGDQGFNLYGEIDPGPFELIKAKPNMKKGSLKIVLRVPVGFPAGTVEIWVGSFKGNVTISGEIDNCPLIANPGQEDADEDGLGDACDECPNDPDNDIDNDTICGNEDNCPLLANSAQEDADGNGIGDACEGPQDSDQDGYDDNEDNCPETTNPLQQDADDDGLGDLCDECPNDPNNDIDNDTICADEDNCPLIANSAQEDADGNGTGDACEGPQDSDQDGYDDDKDNCPVTPNSGQQDADDDGRGDLCDECPNDPNNDIDNDNICADVDNCPLIANSAQKDADGNGIGDACEGLQDSDQDGYDDNEDNCPVTPNPGQQDADDDGTGDACDEDTIYGYISGEFKEGIEVNISIQTDSGEEIVDTLITDKDGYYSIGDLEDNGYKISPEYYDYSFTPNSASIQISTGL